MGKVKCNLKLCPSWNKLKKWNFQFESFVNKCYHLAWDDVYLSHMHPVVLLFFFWRICCRSGDYLPSPPGFPNSPVKEQKNNRVHMGQINIITCKMVAIVNKTLECKFHFSSLFQDGHSSKLTFTLPILFQSKSKWFQNSNSTAFQKTAICKFN